MSNLTGGLTWGGTGVITTYTAAQLAAMALAGELTPNARYIASNNGARYFASDAFTLEPDGPRSVIERRWRAKRDIALRAIADVTAGVGGKAWELNIAISAAGTYTGRFFKTVTTTPACRVTTSNPVVFHDCIFWSATATTGTQAAEPVATGYGGGVYSNVEFHNCIFLSDFQDKSGATKTRSTVERPEAVLFENCTFFGAGVKVSSTATVTSFIFRHNMAYNLDYRQGNGSGGYNGSKSSYCWLQFQAITGMEGVVIERNEAVMRPYDTSSTDYGICEDVINFINAGGSAASPVKVRYNVFYGHYAVIGTATATHASGASIQVEATSSTTPSSYVDVEYNRVIACTAGISLAACNNCNVTYNTVICSGYVMDCPSAKIYSAGFGSYSQNYYSAGPAYVHTRAFANNTIGHARRAGTEGAPSDTMQNLYDVVTNGEDHATFTNETYLVIGDCTQAAEEALYQEWLDECAALGIEVGYKG